MIMTAHILFPALDAERPATLSRPIMTTLLREELGFDGLIVTDCLEMKAITDRWSPEEVAVLAVEAGVDLLLVCHTEGAQRATRDGLLSAVASGRIPEARVDRSVERILAAKRAFGIMDGVRIEPDVAARTVGAAEYRALETEAARAGIAICDGKVRTADGPRCLPLRAGETVVIHGGERLAALLAEALSERGVLARLSDGGEREAADAVVVLAEGLEGVTPEIAGSEGGATGRWIVVALRDPYLLARYPAAPLRLATFGARPCQIGALADALVGRFVPTGRMPVSV
jgi:beta-N-acetylhexosaminidase